MQHLSDPTSPLDFDDSILQDARDLRSAIFSSSRDVLDSWRALLTVSSPDAMRKSGGNALTRILKPALAIISGLAGGKEVCTGTLTGEKATRCFRGHIRAAV